MFDMVSHLQRQREFSEKTFGPGPRLKGVCDHIRKELDEIEADGGPLAEWIDVVILGLDGAWRSGANPEEIITALVAKQTKNEGRKWPDWRTAPPDKAIEHDRSEEKPPQETIHSTMGRIIRQAKEDFNQMSEEKPSHKHYVRKGRGGGVVSTPNMPAFKCCVCEREMPDGSRLYEDEEGHRFCSSGVLTGESLCVEKYKSGEAEAK